MGPSRPGTGLLTPASGLMKTGAYRCHGCILFRGNRDIIYELCTANAQHIWLALHKPRLMMIQTLAETNGSAPKTSKKGWRADIGG